MFLIVTIIKTGSRALQLVEALLRTWQECWAVCFLWED